MVYVSGLAGLGCVASGAAPREADWIRVISAVGGEGSGNAAAAKAWRELAARDVGAVLPILEGLESANELAANWLRSALETIVSREAAAGKTAPAEALEKFVLNQSHPPQARRLAFELMAKADPARSEKLLPGMINDPA